MAVTCGRDLSSMEASTIDPLITTSCSHYCTHIIMTLRQPQHTVGFLPSLQSGLSCRTGPSEASLVGTHTNTEAHAAHNQPMSSSTA